MVYGQKNKNSERKTKTRPFTERVRAIFSNLWRF